MRERAQEWDDDPVGSLDTGIRRRWRRPWNHYLAVLLGFAGGLMVLGSFLDPGWHTVGGVLVLLSPWSITRSDGPRSRPGRPPPPPPTLREELAWLGVAAAQVVVGGVLFSL